MRKAATMFLALAWSGLALAQDASRPYDSGIESGERAARQAAVQILIDQIAPARITPGLSVGQFLDQVGGWQQFRADLIRADAIGGARWPSPQVCQVRLEITGTEIVADLANIAVASGERSPIGPSDLVVVANDLSLRSFTATGTSIAAGIAPLPPPDSPWNAVPAIQRQSMVRLAAQNASQNVVESIAGIPLNPWQTVGDALTQWRIRDQIGQWLDNRPITAVEYLYGDNHRLAVRVTLAASGSQVCDMLRSAMNAANPGPFTASPQPIDWGQVRDQIIRRADPPVGIADLPNTLPPPAAAAIVMPQQPPDWTANTIEATGVSALVVNPLRTARAAESDAQAALQQQVMSLPLSGGDTIGQAAARDPRLQQIISRSIWLDSHVENSDYHADGSVTVRVSLDLHLIWTAIDEDDKVTR